ncbi:fatty acid synthase beta subunit [Xylogone sp. PMI_703]|nr:fatty acid synthase beta subunit [Xylogone sp. PMI_703]
MDSSLYWSFGKLQPSQRDLVLPTLPQFDALETLQGVPAHRDVGPFLPLNRAAAFFKYLLEIRAYKECIAAVITSFEQEVVRNSPIDSIAPMLDEAARIQLIDMYRQVAGSLGRTSESTILNNVKRGTASLLAVFGGQGAHNRNCVAELRKIYNTYQPLLESLIQTASTCLLRVSATVPDIEPSTHAIYLQKWLQNPERMPHKVHLATAPISFPINGIISLANYIIACRTLNLKPHEMRASLVGATGHSQGIIIAAVVSAAEDWDTFYTATANAIELLFRIGWASHHASRAFTRPSPSARDSNIDGAFLSAMLSVKGMNRNDAEKLLKEANAYLRDDEKAYIALLNGSDRVVIAGPTRTLQGVTSIIEKKRAPENADQSKIPFPLRLPVMDYEFFPISAPFHTLHLEEAAKKVYDDVSEIIFKGLNLSVPVYHTRTGEDISALSGKELIHSLIQMIMVEELDWQKACSQTSFTHVLDFGPSRVVSLLQEQLQGSGIRFILAGEQIASSEEFGGKDELFTAYQPFEASNWSKLYCPKLIRYPNGKVGISTRMSSVLKTPPIMVAGMTPTTVPWQFVSCVMKAGYHIELAAGGYSQASKFEDAIRKLAATLPAHRGITCNLIYANPRAMAWQIPLIRRLVSEGINIEGLTIGAGIPSNDIAMEYIQTLGLKHISFKPSSVQSILQVLSIAEANPSFPIGLHWTGGRAGGHHSYEDFHTPLLKTYELIRRHSNAILVVGSGFGDADSILPYLTGEWSKSHGYSKMPVDGVLMGSRLMIAKEARTSQKVKELITATPGTSDQDWYKTYDGPTGGVITVRSEMGEPIHKLATRGVKLWKELDTTIFSIKDPVQRVAALASHREDIINRLIKDYAKPWFAVDSTFKAVEIEDLTYYECLQRIALLMYVRHQKRWVDKSYQTFYLDFINRIRGRYQAKGLSQLNYSADPFTLLNELQHACPELSEDFIYPEDVSFFISLCKRRGQKPVNFIPRLDENFETWFKKDSLWQSEDIDAVVDQDPQRVCIIHGPVAARYSTSTTETAAEILNTINGGLIDMLSSGHNIETAETDIEISDLRSVGFEFADVTSTASHSTYSIKSISESQQDLFISNIAGTAKWIKACLKDVHISRGHKAVNNPIRAAFVVHVGDNVTIGCHPDRRGVKSITLYKLVPSTKEFYPAFSLSSRDGKKITLTLQAPPAIGQSLTTITFDFLFTKDGLYDYVYEVTEERNAKIREFYGSCWSLTSLPGLDGFTAASRFSGGKIKLTQKMVGNFLSSVSKSKSGHWATRYPADSVPMDLGIVIAWPALIKPLIHSDIGGDIFRLLHRSNSFEVLPETEPFKVGDELETSSSITKVAVQGQGRHIEVLAVIRRNGQSVMHVTSAFFIQGETSNSNYPGSSKETTVSLVVNSHKLQSLLLSRSWIKFRDRTVKLIGKSLLFKVYSKDIPNPSIGMARLSVSGEVLNQAGDTIGTIEFNNSSCAGNPVTNFLQRYRTSLDRRKALEHPGWEAPRPWLVRVPDAGREYSDASGDRNPIHVCSVFAGFAQLPSPITHGMYTSALVRMAIEEELAQSDIISFSNWSTSFEDMVRAGDTLRIEMQHVSMNEGRMCFEIQVYNDATNCKVMKAQATAEQARTAYIFCGQGSQVKEMGMALYETDKVAKDMWDAGDRYLSERFGFSLLDIIRRDPKSTTIYFGGPRGRKVRENYLSMTQKLVIGGQEFVVPVISGLTSDSESHTFSDPRGLLFSTQFAQLAITLMNLAEMESLKARGLIQQDAMFAGHSLGEYSALATCSNFMSLENLMSIVFYRGLVMQNSMQRDESGRTDYSMVAVNPSRVGRTFKETDLKQLVELVVSITGVLLEVVNFNVEGQQYVCAGHLEALWILGQACDKLSTMATHTPEDVIEVVRFFAPTAKKLARPIELSRGKATVPLSGIDIPFHSSYLRAGIDIFRECLKEKINAENINPDQLVGKFIPNVTGTPFSLDRSYVEYVADITRSILLKSLIETRT